MNFYPRSPCGERHSVCPHTRQRDAISIHALLAESDQKLFRIVKPSHNFYPRSPCGERQLALCPLHHQQHFYPRSPCGERLLAGPSGPAISFNFYPRSPCGERPKKNQDKRGQIQISIHALLAESDGEERANQSGHCISIHALLAESDVVVVLHIIGGADFYPRSPCGERPVKLFRQNYECFISIHALLAESDQMLLTRFFPGIFLSTLSLRRATIHDFTALYNIFISIHALLAESDTVQIVIVVVHTLFLSTLSLRRATLRVLDGSKSSIISIHALLAESDSLRVELVRRLYDFYPRSPCGERPIGAITYVVMTPDFYPRSPCGERPRPSRPPASRQIISIHALLAESDGGIIWGDFVGRRFLSTLSLRRATGPAGGRTNSTLDFYPRSPCGERLQNNRKMIVSQVFLSTLSLRRATQPRESAGQNEPISIHALLAESDTGDSVLRIFTNGISIHALLAESDIYPSQWRTLARDFYPRSPCGERP